MHDGGSGPLRMVLVTVEFLGRETRSLDALVEIIKEEGVGHGLALRGDILLEDWSSNSLPVFSNWLGMSMKGYETEILELLQKIKGYKGGEVSGWWKEEKELHFFEIRKGIKQA